MFQTCNKKQFANVVTGDENWIYYFEPVRKFSNKIWASKHSRRPIITKRYLSARKIWYAIYFSGEGVAIKVPMENGNKHHRKALQRHSTGEAEKYYQIRRPVTGFKHIRLLHGNVPALASEISTAFWKKENVSVLPHLPYCIDLVVSLCFRNRNNSLLGGNTSPDRLLDLLFISTLLLCPNQRTVTPSGSGYIG